MAANRTGLSGVGTAHLDPLQLTLPVEPPRMAAAKGSTRPQPLFVGAAKAPPPMRQRGERALMSATAGTGVVTMREGSAVWLCG